MIQSLYWNKQDVVIQIQSSVVKMERANQLIGEILWTGEYLIHIISLTSAIAWDVYMSFEYVYKIDYIAIYSLYSPWLAQNYVSQL